MMLTVNPVGIFFIKHNKKIFVIEEENTMNQKPNYGNWIPENSCI